jgi:ABC-type antimicrobial peptide transport system permease subunit
MLAISFISGSMIAIDSSSSALMRSALEKVPVDLTLNAYGVQSANVTQQMRAITAIEGVTDVTGVESFVSIEPIINYGGGIDPIKIHSANNANHFWSISAFASWLECPVFLSQNSSRIISSGMFNGSLPSPGTIVVTKYIAAQLGVDIGDKVILSFSKANYSNLYGSHQYVNKYINFTFIVSQIWTPNVHQGVSFSPIVFNMADMGTILSDETIASSYSIQTQYMVWIDRTHVISIGDSVSTSERLQSIQNGIQLSMDSVGIPITIDNKIMQSIKNLMSQLDGYKVTFFALSLPVIVLGVYISTVGVELGMRDRRREIGVLKARGANNRQVYSNMMVESISLGAFSGITGLVLGVVVSRILLDATISFMGAYGNAQLTDISIGIETIIVTVLIGIALMIASSYRQIKIAIKTDVAEALHYSIPGESKREYDMKWDVACLAFVMLAIISVVFVDLRDALQNSNSFFTQVTLMTLLALGIAIVPLMPLLLSVSLVRLITRGPKKLYTKFSRLMKPWTKQLHYIVERNVERNPKRASNLTMIIALALALGLFTSMTMESELAYEMEQEKIYLGSDVYVDSYYYGEPLNLSKLNDLGKIDNLRDVSIGYSFKNDNLVAVDAKSYFDAVSPADYCFVGKSAFDSLNELRENGTALVSERFMEQVPISGNIISSFYYPVSNSSEWVAYNVSLRVIGQFIKLPGYLDRCEVLVNLSVITGILNQQQIMNGSFQGARALIKMDDGANQTIAAQKGEEIFAAAGFKATFSMDLDSQLDYLRHSPSYGALAGFFNSEYIISIITMSVGVAIIISITVTDRRQELACIIARGSSASQMRKMLMGESISLMILGILIGVSVGFLTAYLFNLLSADLSGAIGHYLVFTWVSLILIFVSIISLLLASLLATSRAGKIKLAEILRIRGG